jgi:hypothetical protein
LYQCFKTFCPGKPFQPKPITANKAKRIPVLDSSLTLNANFRLSWKGLPRTNTLAYLTSLSSTKKKVFVTLTPGVNVIKLFFFIADDEAK